MSAQDIYTPFTYLIGWPDQDKWYYGVRFAKGCSPEDLWNTYFTSSKYVSEARKTFGEPPIVEVRRTFSDPEAARDWETKVLKRLNVRNNDRFLNICENKAAGSYPGEMNGMFGWVWGDEHPRGMAGKQHSEETKARMSKVRKGQQTGELNGMFGKPHSEETRKKMRESHKGRVQEPHSDEAKEKIRLAALNRPKYPCSYCDRTFAKSNLGLHERACAKRYVAS